MKLIVSINLLQKAQNLLVKVECPLKKTMKQKL